MGRTLEELAVGTAVDEDGVERDGSSSSYSSSSSSGSGESMSASADLRKGSGTKKRIYTSLASSFLTDLRSIFAVWESSSFPPGQV